ncbi:MAG: hypoxanthine phosphoribosyltransferase [bacterium]
MNLHNDIREIILPQDEINSKVKQLGETITEDFHNHDILVVGVLRGCVTFISDLMREVELPLEIDFLAVGSYGKSSESSGVVRVLKDLNETIEDRHVLLVEDIVDTGLTLNFLLGYLKARNPASVSVCSLLDKPARREVDVKIDYGGFEVPNEFLVGYGLDYAQKYRNLPYIGSLKDEVIQEDD